MLELSQKTYIKKVIVLTEGSSARARAERLVRVRNMANLKRPQMCDDGSINANTYKGWEIGRYGGLPADGAAKVIARVAREGVTCTRDWLLHGTGIGPYVMPVYEGFALGLPRPSEDQEEHAMIDEMAIFVSQYPGAVTYKIEDDGLTPYLPGETVAGLPRYKEQIKNISTENCIVQLETGVVVARQLKPDDTPGRYTLICTNPHTTVKKPIIYDVALISAAPIIRHYRKNPNK